jgi:ribosomal protein S6
MKEKEDIYDETQIYEVGFHILPTIPEEKLQEIVSKLQSSITQNEGVIISEEFPKMRGLSYEIKKRVETKYLNFDRAYFGWIKFETLHASIDKIEEGIKDNQSILRFIIVKTVRENTIHAIRSPMMMKGNSTEETKTPISQPIEKTAVSEAEIDKSIDELVINQTL